MKTIDIIKINVVILFTLAFLVLLTVFTIQYFYWYNQVNFTSEAIKNYTRALRNLRITIYVYTIIQGMRFELWWILKKHSKKKQG